MAASRFTLSGLESADSQSSNNFTFCINENIDGPDILVQVCLERGWIPYKIEESSNQCGLWWRTKGRHISDKFANGCKNVTFSNRIPGASHLCRKDNLHNILKHMRVVYGAVYDFLPETYQFPRDSKKFVLRWQRRIADGLSDQIWISKPFAQSRGKGIVICSKLSEILSQNKGIIQRYLTNPLLIGGYKFDIRLYVVVRSYKPLSAYIYREGICRFATDKFSLANIDNIYAHLTNTTLNKKGPGYAKNKEKIGTGCKWSLKHLRTDLRNTIGSDWLLWQRISALISLTLIAQSTKMCAQITDKCFELYGFDVLVDSNLKPWLLEVNSNPSLNIDCQLDLKIKKPMLNDLFDLLNLPNRKYLNSTHTAVEKDAKIEVFDAFGDATNHWHQIIYNFSEYECPVASAYSDNAVYDKTLVDDKNVSERLLNDRSGMCNNLSTKYPIRSSTNLYDVIVRKNIRIVENAKVFHNRDYAYFQVKNQISGLLNFLKCAERTYRANKDKSDETLNKLPLSRALPNKECYLWLPLCFGDN